MSNHFSTPPASNRFSSRSPSTYAPPTGGGPFLSLQEAGAAQHELETPASARVVAVPPTGRGRFPSLLEPEASQDVFEMTASAHDVAARDLRALWCGQSSRGPSGSELSRRSSHRRTFWIAGSKPCARRRPRARSSWRSLCSHTRPTSSRWQCPVRHARRSPWRRRPPRPCSCSLVAFLTCGPSVWYQFGVGSL